MVSIPEDISEYAFPRKNDNICISYFRIRIRFRHFRMKSNRTNPVGLRSIILSSFSKIRLRQTFANFEVRILSSAFSNQDSCFATQFLLYGEGSESLDQWFFTFFCSMDPLKVRIISYRECVKDLD